MTSLMTL